MSSEIRCYVDGVGNVMKGVKCYNEPGSDRNKIDKVVSRKDFSLIILISVANKLGLCL